MIINCVCMRSFGFLMGAAAVLLNFLFSYEISFSFNFDYSNHFYYWQFLSLVRLRPGCCSLLRMQYGKGVETYLSVLLSLAPTTNMHPKWKYVKNQFNGNFAN